MAYINKQINLMKLDTKLRWIDNIDYFIYNELCKSNDINLEILKTLKAIQKQLETTQK